MLSLINYNIKKEPMAIVLTVGGAHLRVFLGNSILGVNRELVVPVDIKINQDMFSDHIT